MLDQKIINYLKSNNAWFENSNIDSSDYIQALDNLKIDKFSDFGYFYSYAEEDSGGFYSRSFELWQICWMYINGNYEKINKSLIRDLNLNENYYALTSFEGDSAYFYNKENDSVQLVGFSEKGIKTLEIWDSFNLFLLWYFDI